MGLDWMRTINHTIANCFESDQIRSDPEYNTFGLNAQQLLLSSCKYKAIYNLVISNPHV